MEETPRDTLQVKALELSNFRSHERLFLNNLKQLTILVGPNGIGKTNVLEALSLVCAAQSFRNATAAGLLREGAESGRLKALLTSENRAIDIEMILEDGKKRWVVNGKNKRAADLSTLLPVVVFSPDDLQLAKKASGAKRDALDSLGAQLSASYKVVKQDYDKVIRYKNKLLKEEAEDALIDSINETLITCGSQLFCYRRALFERLTCALQEKFAELSTGSARPEVLGTEFSPSWEGPVPETRDEVAEALRAALAAQRENERARKVSTVGPHRDQYVLTLNGRDVASFASQGQQRTIVLAWKLAEVSLINQSLGVNPIMLLDDVMSELDSTRRDQLVRFVNSETQTFITTTDLEAIDARLRENAQVVSLSVQGEQPALAGGIQTVASADGGEGGDQL